MEATCPQTAGQPCRDLTELARRAELTRGLRAVLASTSSAGADGDVAVEIPSSGRVGMLPRGVFIAHGTNPEWLAVRRFIEEQFELPAYSF